MQEVSWLDIAIFATGLVSVWLVVREHVATWPVGLVNSGLFLVSLWRVGLYANAALQVGFVVLGVYGWWRWRHPDPGRVEVLVTRTPPSTAAALPLLAAIAIAATWGLLAATDDPDPFLDAATLVGSLVAQYLLTVKHLATWTVWLVVDVATVPLLLHQHLQWTALLFVVYTVLSVVGLRSWRDSMQARAVAEAVR